jgi:hypothetical protein
MASALRPSFLSLPFLALIAFFFFSTVHAEDEKKDYGPVIGIGLS